MSVRCNPSDANFSGLATISENPGGTSGASGIFGIRRPNSTTTNRQHPDHFFTHIRELNDPIGPEVHSLNMVCLLDACVGKRLPSLEQTLSEYRKKLRHLRKKLHKLYPTSKQKVQNLPNSNLAIELERAKELFEKFKAFRTSLRNIASDSTEGLTGDNRKNYLYSLRRIHKFISSLLASDDLFHPYSRKLKIFKSTISKLYHHIKLSTENRPPSTPFYLKPSTAAFIERYFYHTSFSIVAGPTTPRHIFFRRLVAQKLRPVTYAIKTPNEFTARWDQNLNEALISGSLPFHPNVLDIILVSDVLGPVKLYLPKQSCDLKELQETFLHRQEIQTHIKVMHQILKGLLHLHTHGIHHRDIKPGNILYDESSKSVRIADFGLSELPGHHHPGAGTDFYEPPQKDTAQCPLTLSSDIWSTGITFWVTLTSMQFKLSFSDCNHAALDSSKERTKALNKKMIENPELYQEKITKLIDSLNNPEHSIRCKNPKEIPSKIQNQIKNLLKAMLQIDPDSRISANEALAHPLFAEIENDLCEATSHNPSARDEKK